jgi:hypothetical protein
LPQFICSWQNDFIDTRALGCYPGARSCGEIRPLRRILSAANITTYAIFRPTQFKKYPRDENPPPQCLRTEAESPTLSQVRR